MTKALAPPFVVVVVALRGFKQNAVLSKDVVDNRAVVEQRTNNAAVIEINKRTNLAHMFQSSKSDNSMTLWVYVQVRCILKVDLQRTYPLLQCPVLPTYYIILNGQAKLFRMDDPVRQVLCLM